MAEEKIESDVIPKEEKITEDVVITKKDPKRVEQGKRLAAISRKRRKKKCGKEFAKKNFLTYPIYRTDSPSYHF